MARPKTIVFAVCFLAFCLHAGFSLHSRGLKSKWANVPPVPGEAAAAMMALGDRQFAYRMIGTMIQNLGDVGGNVTPLAEYDYERLARWFFLEDRLDPRSDFIPMLAAYYFGGTQEPADLTPVIDYLAMVGQHPYEQKWRWLAQAVYLSRFRQNDLNRAQELAGILAGLWSPGMPGWARQMPVFIATAKGDKESAYALMTQILRDEAENMHPAEVNFMVGYICERILDAAAAAKHPLCNIEK